MRHTKEKGDSSMSQCKFIEECAFYNNRLEGIPNEGEFFKKLFCLRMPEKCARLKTAGIVDVSDIRNTANPLGIEYGRGSQA